MPIHPGTGIVYGEGFYNSTFVVMKNGEITNYSASWLRLDGAAIVGGLPAGEEYYLREPPANRGAYDDRYIVDSSWDAVPYAPAKPEGYPTGVYRETLIPRMKSAGELKADVTAIQQDADRSIWPTTWEPSKVVTALAAASKTVLSPYEEELIASVQGAAQKMAVNAARAEQIFVAIDAGQPYDPTVGWERG